MTQASQENAAQTAEVQKPRHDGSDSQEVRWAKYGANVALSCALVLVLAGVVTWGSGKYNKRFDVTSAGDYSLKPQTISIINKLDQPVTLVSLYPELKKQASESDAQDFRQPVVDLIQEYRSKGRNIEVRVIDPVADPGSYYAWLDDVKRKYGGDVKAYEELLNQFPATIKEIKKLADDEVNRMQPLAKVEVTDERQAEILDATYTTVLAFPRLLQVVQSAIEEDTKEMAKEKGRIRDYKGQVETVRSSLDGFSRRLKGLNGYLEKLKGDEKAPEAVRKYATESIPRFEALRKKADELVEKSQKLTDLKLDEIRQKLATHEEGKAPPSTIAVMGDKDIKFISFADVWKSGESFGMGAGNAPPKLRFAGEQRITAAMLSLTQKSKQKVAFVRSGGPPVTTAMMGESGEFQEVAERLQAYNFEVLERDLSGMWAMQSMQRGMPSPPEANDEQLKDAIWVVVSRQPSFGMMGQNQQLGEKVSEHLKRGGSALLLFHPRADNLEAALKDWGVRARTDYVVLHEAIETAAGSSGDLIEDAKRLQHVFVINRYGEHPLSAPLATLDSVFIFPTVIETQPAQGCKVVPIIPLPATPKTWGEHDIGMTRANERFTFDPETDLAGPFHLGATVEKEGAGRIVAIGSVYFGSNQLVNFPDPKMYEKYKLSVSRFPGNGELFTNSIFWLAKMDSMMSLSPAAMEVSRIAPIGTGMLQFWRIGVLLILLPLLVVAVGLRVYVARRD